MSDRPLENFPPLDLSAGARILASSFYQDLRSSGYTVKHLLAISTQLIELITLDLLRDRQEVKNAA